jgi:hypothetical protein
MTFDARASALIEYLEIAVLAVAGARRLALEAVVPDEEADDLPDIPDGPIP